ncbi:MAG: sigma-70 family RNA polymerase sigma factor [Planctomycetaceae bacterium]|nr:sigma-70 family RNA polymerase sigma factor [Planctomycetaceae bacterium]
MDPNDSVTNSSVSSSDRRRFATTSWSLVGDAAGDGGSKVARQALQELCQLYWYPLYSFSRRQGFDPTEAEDVTQGFFAQMLAGELLAKADAGRGRFRTFLLAALTNYTANIRRDRSALKRGGGTKTLSLDYLDAERRYCLEPASNREPQHVFETQWALELLRVALAAVRDQYEAMGKMAIFEALSPRLTDPSEGPLAEIAQQLNMQVGAVKVALLRLRERYGQQIRLQIAKTLDDPSGVDDEIRELFQAISQNRL